ncbi:MAG: SGNH/GDSL hydrolase family protein [Acidobacteriaceae bacterium]|nr:SGNH/GDSL hydrolase family protein [Acidobacteriaceae bacterium]
MTTSPRLSRLLLLLALTTFAATTYAAPPADHWVGTWATAPMAANNGRPAATPAATVAAPAVAATPALAPATPAAPATSTLTPIPPPPVVHAPAFVYGAADTTIREIVHVSLGGPMVRVILTNEFGSDPLTIAAAHVAISQSGSTINLLSASGLTFGGRNSVTIPPGALVVSDPAQMKVPAGSDLAISLFLPAQPIKVLSQHSFADQTSYIAEGNVVGAKTLENAGKITSWPFVKGVDVKVSADSAAIVAFGDSITDGAHSTPNTNQRWPDLLARRLQADPKTANLAVLNEGIGGNRILHDTTGPSALARFDRDVLAQSGVKYVILLESINDIGHAYAPSKPYDVVTADDLIAGLSQLAERAHTHGIKVYAATLTPYVGAGYSSPAGEQVREAVNQWIRTTAHVDGFLDFDKATQDPANPTAYAPFADSGDHLHPGDAGYKAMADSIDLKLFTAK